MKSATGRLLRGLGIVLGVAGTFTCVVFFLVSVYGPVNGERHQESVADANG